MEFWQERGKGIDPLRETWEAISSRVRLRAEKPWVYQALERANKICSSLFWSSKFSPSPLEYLKLKETAEWQVFYTFLLERFVKTDEKLKEAGWKRISQIIDPVRVDLFKKITLPVIKVERWIKKADNAAQMIVAVYRDKKIELGLKNYKIARLASKFSQELAEIYQSQGKE